MRRLGILSRLAALALLPLVAACSEQIESGAACPQLCPTENVPVSDTTLDAVVVDSTFTGYPFPGGSPWLLVASRPRPDSLDVRAVVRFDTLPKRYFPTGAADSVAISKLDSSYVIVHVDTAAVSLAQPATISVYDVDTTAVDDTTAASINPLFRRDRFLGSVTLPAGAFTTDSIRIPISDSALLAKVQDSLRLRIGFRITSSAFTQLRIASFQAGTGINPVRVSFDPVSATDTTYAPIVLSPTSSTPAGDAETARAMSDFTVVAVGSPPPVGNDVLVGGLPARRTFLRFSVPSRFVDSATIVRAVLLLTQRPFPGAERTDTVQLQTNVVVAEQSISDIRRAVDLSAPGSAFGVDSLRLSPADSGSRSVSLVNLVRAWHSLPSTTQRAVVFSAQREGAQVSALRFVSIEGPSAGRPRLRISYIPRTEFALP